MLESILCIITVIVLLAAVFFLKDSIVPKLVKLSGFIGAGTSLFLPAYSINIMGQSFDVNIIDCITGINMNSDYGHPINIKSNLFYIVLFIIPVTGIIVTLIKNNKIANIVTAILSLIGIFIACLMLFKQLEIGSIIKISANIGIAVMFAAYIISIAISIIMIYGSINKEEDSLAQINNEENDDTNN